MSQDPTRRNEDEYFARQNAELLAEHRARLDAERASRTEAGQGLRCPRDGAVMFERAHHGVAIDVCPDCGGIFLDRGELDLLAHVEDQEMGRAASRLFAVRR